MAEIVNLRRARKARQREQDAADAAANRARHGRPKADTAAARQEAARAARALDGARRAEDGPEPSVGATRASTDETSTHPADSAPDSRPA